MNLATGPKGLGKFRYGVTDKYDDANNTGIFRYRISSVYCVHERKCRHIWHYYLTKEGSFPPYSRPGNSNFPTIASDEHFLSNIDTRSESVRKALEIEEGEDIAIKLSIKK